MPWMFRTILRNLFSRPVTRRYPDRDAVESVPGYRGKIRFDSQRCDLCADCSRVCPSQAIEVSLNKRLITYDPFRCIYCGACVEACLPRAIGQDVSYTSPAPTKEVDTVRVPL